MLLHSASQHGTVQQPVVHGLVPQGNTANVTASVHIPRSHSNPQLDWLCKVAPPLEHALLQVAGTWEEGGEGGGGKCDGSVT